MAELDLGALDAEFKNMKRVSVTHTLFMFLNSASRAPKSSSAIAATKFENTMFYSTRGRFQVKCRGLGRVFGAWECGLRQYLGTAKMPSYEPIAGMRRWKLYLRAYIISMLTLISYQHLTSCL